MAESPSFRFDVFLSHNSADKPRVRRLAERLKAAGMHVWLDEWIIQAGDIISRKVDEGLEQSRVLLLCISPAALASGWVALERSTAIHRDPANAGRRFIPVLLGDCALPDTLAKYKYVDLRVESETAFAKVLATCQSEAAEALQTTKVQRKWKLWRNKLRQKSSNKSRVPKDQLISVLTGHKGPVWSVAVSPDLQWAASGSVDGKVKVWDLQSGECRATLKGHSKHFSVQIACVAITGDGKRILSASHDTTLRIWDAETNRELANFEVHEGSVHSVVAFQNKNHALSGGSDKVIRLWDIDTLSWLDTFEGQIPGIEAICSIAVNSNGTYALSGHPSGKIRIWEIRSGRLATDIQAHSQAVRAVQFTPNGLFGISSSEDRTIKVWDLEAKACVGTLEGHNGSVDSLAISAEGSVIASIARKDQGVRLWDWKSGECLQIIEHDKGAIPTCVAFGPNGSRLVVGTHQGRIFVYGLTGLSRAPETAHRYVNAKVVLLGEGTVGKSSLAHRLIEDKFVIRDRTHGMHVWRLDLALPPNATLECEALLWDLAGQEDYRLIHQLFLDETALALLLINPQKEDPFVEAGEWLKALKTAAKHLTAKRDAPRLLIFSQVDVGGMKLGNAKIERFREQHGFADWLPTSAKTGENCSDKNNNGNPSRLKQLIAASIPWDKLPWTSTPRLLTELKNAVMAMRDESDIRLLRFSELAQRLEQVLPGEKFAEPDVRTAVTLLANHGLARPLKFGDLVLLRPDLINGYAAAVIRAARAHTDEIGSVQEADIYRADFDFTGVERLKHRPDEELLLRALVQTFLDHSLCIAEETPQGRHLIFPSQYRREKDIPHEPDIFVSYTFSGEWQTVWTTLVVRLWYSQEFAHRELWRNAAEFESARKQTLGLKITKTGDGTATISLYFDVKVPDELKVIFIEYVHRHLARYACEVVRDRRYMCPDCGTLVTDFNAVRRRLESKKDFITCQQCDGKVPFIDFIEQRLKIDPVARKILAMDETATRGLDTQALEQILIGHMMAIAGEANQIFRPATMFDYGIDGEVEFKDNDGKASGKKIYIQLKSGNSYIRTRKADGREVFDVKNDRHIEYWMNQPVDVYLVIRQTHEMSGQEVIRWMNVTRYLQARRDQTSRQILFDGEKLDMEAVWKVRDEFFASTQKRK